MRKHAILWILLLALAVRLYHITFPIEGWHAWRQADTAAIARNFYDNGFDFFHPQASHAGAAPGYVDAEFPIYPYLIALLWKLFGVHDGWGRLVSALGSLGTIYFLYALSRRYVGRAAALWAAFVYAVLPLNVYYGRTFMPQSATLCCTVGGIYFFSEWLERRTRGPFVLSVFLIALATLMNPTTLVIGLPLAYLSSLAFGRRWVRSPRLWLYATIAIVPAALWYAYSRLALYSPGLSIGIWQFGSDKWGNFGLLASAKFYHDVFLKSIAERHLTYAGTIPFVAGLLLKDRSPGERMFGWWLVAVVIYFLIVPRGNDVHEYYQLPFILPAAVYVGKTFAAYLTPGSGEVPAGGGARAGEGRAPGRERPLRWLFSACLIAIIPLSVARYLESFARREAPHSPMASLAEEIGAVTDSRDLIVTVSGGDAVVLYRSHRKGWVVSPDGLDAAYIEAKRAHGARYVAGLKSAFDTEERRARLRALTRGFPPVKETREYFMLKVDQQ